MAVILGLLDELLRGAYLVTISGFYTRLQLTGALEYIHRISKMAA